jgi:hypothetical protein
VALPAWQTVLYCTVLYSSGGFQSPSQRRSQRHHHLLNMSQSPASSSKTPATTASSSNFDVIFDKALKAYKTKTKQDLITHPLASQLQACHSPATILTVLQGQVRQFENSRGDDERLWRWLNPTINVLYAFSATLGQGVGLVHCQLIRWWHCTDGDSIGFLSRQRDFRWRRSSPLGKSSR